MKKLLIGTTNPGKLREYKTFFTDLPLELVSLSDIGLDLDVEETGTNYQENAELKSKTYAKLSGLPTLSDDGGIEIAALDGAPGLKSHRWVGSDATDEDIVNHMIKVAKELDDNNRDAKFKLMISFALPDGQVWSELGEVQGIISKEPNLKLLQGYPYRSFFYLPKLKKHYHESELTKEEMAEYNHRYKAVVKIKPTIRRVLSI